MAAPDRRWLLLLALLVVSQLVDAAQLIAADRSLPILKGHQCHDDARRMQRVFAEVGPLGDGHGPPPILELTRPWPPLQALNAQWAFALFGPTVAAHRAATLPWLALLLVATFLLGRRLSDDPGGLLAATALAGAPMLLGHRATTMPFVLEAATVTASAAALVALHQDGGRRHALVAGLFAGLALLTRLDTTIYLGILAAWFLATTDERRRFVPAAIAAAVTAGWWHGPGLFEALQLYLHEGLLSGGVENEGFGLLTVQNLVYYPARLVAPMLGAPLAVAAVAGVVVLARQRRDLLLVAWAALPILVYTVIPMKGARYLMPALPAAALAAAVTLRRLPDRRPAIALGALSVLQWLALVHAPIPAHLWSGLHHTPDRWGARFEAYEDALDHGLLRPYREPTWRDAIAALGQAIDERHRGDRAPTLAVADALREYVSPLLYRRHIALVEDHIIGQAQETDVASRYLEADFLILSSRTDPRDPERHARLTAAAEGRPLIARVRLPDGTHARLLGPR